MNDPFGKINYKKNFLKNVIVRVDFLSPLPGVAETIPPSLSDVAIAIFPIPEPRDAVEHEVQVSVTEVKSMQERRYKEWRFHGRDRTKTLAISPHAVFVEYSSYKTYEVIKQEFIRILEGVAQHFSDAQSKRVGLRYVNSIELQEANPTEWSGYLTPQLLSMFEFPPLEDREDRKALSRTLHQMELAFEAFNLRYVYGMHNPDYPARIRRKAFVLDLDASATSVVELGKVGPLLDDFHATIQRYFENSIGEKLRSILNGD